MGVTSIFDKYDLVDVDEGFYIPEKPNSGVVLLIGGSGTGKTTILKKWGMSKFNIDDKTPIYKLFSSEEMAEDYLISAGLRSVPAWKRSLSNLSMGERHRAEIAINLSKENLFIDEFTSLVDRDTARALCHSINKMEPKNLVLATCHKDVAGWINADHVYSTDSSRWLDRGFLRRNSSRTIKIRIEAADAKAVWGIFKKHHYLSGKINPAASCFVAYYNNTPIAMMSVISYPCGTLKNAWRGHRTVVLPEFQGMGIGTAISDEVAKYITSQGCRFFSKTSHPAMGGHRENSKNWRPTSKNKKARKDYNPANKTKEDGHKMKHAHRICFSHEYIGEG